MAVAKKRKPASKTGVKASSKKSETKSGITEVTASAAQTVTSNPVKTVKPKTTGKKSVKKESKAGSDSPKVTRSKPVSIAPENKSVSGKTEFNTSGITKVYIEKKESCKVTFRLPRAAVSKASTVCIVGDFNDWNIYADPMTRCKDGTYSIDLELSKGKEYQFRYLIDDNRWENDWNADKYVKNPFGDSDNSVVIV